MKRPILLFLFLAGLLHGYTQVAPDKYFVEFTDKNNSPYSLSRPLEFLSQRALDRRQAQGIQLEANDIPVNPAYIQGVAAQGVTVINTTKWLNGAIIFSTDPARIQAIEELPYVKTVLKNKHILPVYQADKFSTELERIPGPGGAPSLKQSTALNYGLSFNQVHMLHGDKLHDMGYLGQGIVIAVLDAGFLNADILPVFDSLRLNGQILGTRDFVAPGSNVYTGHPHGMMVLSTMGGNLPGQLVGTAPKADYWLLRSEDANSEYIIEEYNWVSAAEFADSVGADVINSSLGYTTFDDSTQNHTWEMLDGNTTPCAQGANAAASKGILVVNSAGNSGQQPWRYIGTPADANDVIAVAAVDSAGIYAPFSSVGWISPLRVKPNVAAQGKGPYVAWADGSIGRSNGTSFSSPILAGTAASFMSGRRGIGAMDVKRMIEESGSQFTHPDTLLGFGIPDFQVPLGILSQKPGTVALQIIPNPVTGDCVLAFQSPSDQRITVELYLPDGRRISAIRDIPVRGGENRIRFILPAGLPAGIYLVRGVNTGTDQSIFTGKMTVLNH